MEFDPLFPQAVGNYGLLMRKREKALPGELNLDISTNLGSEFRFRIPLANLQAGVENNQMLLIYRDFPITPHF